MPHGEHISVFDMKYILCFGKLQVELMNQWTIEVTCWGRIFQVGNSCDLTPTHSKNSVFVFRFTRKYPANRKSREMVQNHSDHRVLRHLCRHCVIITTKSSAVLTSVTTCTNTDGAHRSDVSAAYRLTALALPTLVCAVADPTLSNLVFRLQLTVRCQTQSDAECQWSHQPASG